MEGTTCCQVDFTETFAPGVNLFTCSERFSFAQTFTTLDYFYTDSLHVDIFKLFYWTCYCELIDFAPCRPSEELVFIGTTSTGEILQSLSLANNTISAVAFKVCISTFAVGSSRCFNLRTFAPKVFLRTDYFKNLPWSKVKVNFCREAKKWGITAIAFEETRVEDHSFRVFRCFKTDDVSLQLSYIRKLHYWVKFWSG